jgi:hypothetical protein
VPRSILSAPAKPAHYWVPEDARHEVGDAIADMAVALGFQVEEPERLALRALAPARRDGSWATLSSAIVCGRQNIKTWALEMVVVSDVWDRGIKRATWTSHRYKTTQQAFQDIVALVDNFDWLRKRVHKVRTAKGEEGFELTSGARLDYLSRSTGGGRGLTGDTVVLDEALFLSPTMMGALIPTLSSRPNPHVLYGSSPGLRESEVLRNIRDRGRASNDPSLSYIEWASDREPCAASDCNHSPGVAGCRLDDEKRWYLANPALGRRISLDYVRMERRELPPAEFMRERLGWWEDPPTMTDAQIISPDDWAAAISSEPLPDDCRVALAVDTSWDRMKTWITAAAERPGGLVDVSLVADDLGTEWVVDRLRPLVERLNPVGIGLQASGAPVSSLVEPLRAAFGDLVRPLSGQDLARACGATYDVITSRKLTHADEPALNEAVKGVVVRPFSDAWLWDRKISAVDVAPLVGVTEALYLLQTIAAPPKRRSSRAFGF